MSRLWSRFGIRALAIVLLVAGVAGGMYLGTDREAQQRGINASLATQAESTELELMRQRQAEQTMAAAQARAAAREAAAKAAAAAEAAAERARRADQEVSRKKSRAATGSAAPVKPFGPIPKSCAEFSGNKGIGCALLLQAGFGLDQMTCLSKLWDKESHWRTKAENKSSGAYGIPQALPGDKMASVGADWRTNPATQIKWGLKYIKGRYGSPCKAWAHSQSKGWY